mgnify:CR=1 FL=1
MKQMQFMMKTCECNHTKFRGVAPPLKTNFLPIRSYCYLVGFLRWMIPLLLFSSLSSCTTNTQLYQLSNPTENQQLLLRKKIISKPTSGLLIMGKGYIDGEARITLLLDGEVYKTKIVSGNVRFQWRENWRGNRAILRYQPARVTEGNLRFSVTFMD